jgi:hypothetical protein
MIEEIRTEVEERRATFEAISRGLFPEERTRSSSGRASRNIAGRDSGFFVQ